MSHQLPGAQTSSKEWTRILLLLFGVLGSLALLEPRFLSSGNLQNVLSQIAIDGIVAVGLTFIILTGGLDLSVGAVMALSGVVLVLTLSAGIVPAGLFALLAGGTVGALNGYLIGMMGLNPLIVTLGTMSITQGLALWLTRGQPIAGPGGNFEMLGGGYLLHIPSPLVLFVVAAIGAHQTLRNTQFGRDLYAIGSNRQAARVADLPTEAREVWACVLCSVLAALAGIVLASRLNTGSPIIGQDAPLQAIAAVVLGGTSLQGGKGGVLQTAIGILIIGGLANGLNLMNVSPAYQWALKGLILISVAGLDSAGPLRFKPHAQCMGN